MTNPLPSQSKANGKRCASKQAYLGPLAAFKALAAVRAKGRTEKRAYRCNVCRCWHLTSRPFRATGGPWPDCPCGIA